jgi:tryptophan synthase alpha chain
MSSIAQTFERLRAKGERAFVAFVTAGDPPLEHLPAILEMLQEAGADIIELGIPFSDPIADGPTIQASSQRALDRGVTPTAALEALSRAKLDVPVVLMGYYNPVLRRGVREFARQAKAAGASGTIISDLTPEEAHPWIDASKSEGLDNIFLVAPTSTDERVTEACRFCTGFVYAVSRTGVTGSTASVPEDVQRLVGKIKACSGLPVCVGFGITKPEHVRTVCEVADGAVVGSWLVDLLQREWKDGKGRTDIARQLADMKAATR